MSSNKEPISPETASPASLKEVADCYVGEIRFYAGTRIPDGWLLCDGSLYADIEYEMLYSLIGTLYGEGTVVYQNQKVNAFGVPDFRGRLPIGAGRAENTSTNYKLGQKGGNEYIALTERNLPNHSHPGTISYKNIGLYAAEGNAGLPAPVPDVALSKTISSDFQYSAFTYGPQQAQVELAGMGLDGGVLAKSRTAGSSGGSNLNAMQSLSINAIIAFEGLWPGK